MLAKFFIFLLFVESSAMALFEKETSLPKPLRPRVRAPNFDALAVVDEKFERLRLSDYEGKWLVLFFYPFDFTFVCPTEIVSFSERLADFKAEGANVVAASTDSHHTHLAWVRTARTDGGLGHVDIPLIADISKKMSRDYGVLVDDPDDEMYGAALRGLFIIDPTGQIRSMQINDDHVGRSVDETLRLIKAFKFADKNGEVCPGNWQPGDATITPTPDGSKKFFANDWVSK
eukprot:g2680.t1